MKNGLYYKENHPADFSISHKIGEAHKRYLHYHNRFEIFLNLTDGTLFYLDDKVYSLKKNDLVLLNNLDIHRTSSKSNMEYERYVILFKPEFVSQFSIPGVDLLEYFTDPGLNFNRCIHLSEEQTAILLDLIKKARYYLKNKVYGAEIYKRITLVEILLAINSFYRSAEDYIPHDHNKDVHLQKIRPVLTYIKEYLSSDLSLEQLAEYVHLDKFYLSRLFKSATGSTISGYITNMRILKAMELLTKDYSVSKVSAMVGFNSYTHFISTFKKHTGITPKQYKIKNANAT